ncbi:hypothetical protein CRUP_002471 [Coryphaenoides rupestris]|nr:hypothetical protein CRUP_002471 [Coryphaenoides rupestris]
METFMLQEESRVSATTGVPVEGPTVLHSLNLPQNTEYEIVAPYEVDHRGQFLVSRDHHQQRGRRRRSLQPDASPDANANANADADASGNNDSETVHFRLSGLGQDFHLELRESSASLLAPGFTVQGSLKVKGQLLRGSLHMRGDERAPAAVAAAAAAKPRRCANARGCQRTVSTDVAQVLLLFHAVGVVIAAVMVAAVTGATAADVDGGNVAVSVPFARRGVRGDRTRMCGWWLGGPLKFSLRAQLWDTGLRKLTIPAHVERATEELTLDLNDPWTWTVKPGARRLAEDSLSSRWKSCPRPLRRKWTVSLSSLPLASASALASTLAVASGLASGCSDLRRLPRCWWVIS